MAKVKVGIVFGGKSTEHEVSLQSAKNIVKAIDSNKFEVSLLGIDKQGQWHLYDSTHFLDNADDPAHIALIPSTKSIQLPAAQNKQIAILEQNGSQLTKLDVIFPIVHGHLGEDGALQGLLRTLDIPFVGAGVLGSAVCMDKDVTKRLLRDAGLQVAPFVTLTRSNRHQYDFTSVSRLLGTPLFIKPANLGSSVGVSKVHNQEEYQQALDLGFSFDHKVLVESAIIGREIECAVLGNDQPQASVCGEIILSDEFYAYDTKYIDDDGAKVMVPALISQEVNDKIRQIALKTFQTLDCLGMARVDVFLTADEQVIINEVNTLPGFTNISMYPKLWQASGLSYTDLISRLIELALDRHAQDQALQSTVGQ